MRRGLASHDLDEWRHSARALLAEGVRPEHIVWSERGASGLLFEEAGAAGSAGAAGAGLRVPRAFVEIAERVLCHRDPGRFDTLYKVLYRLTHGEPGLLADAADVDVHALRGLEKAVDRDLHKMKAFVRFVRVGAGAAGEGADEAFVAWYAPEHRVVRLVAPFFAERFASMRWTILTPDESVAWDGEGLRSGPGVPRHAAAGADELEDLWRTYYASIFNPARVNPRAMRQHMPAHFWKTMPETAIIPALLAQAPGRVHEMIAGPASASEAFLPARRELPVLRDAARACTACELCREGTQTVFGEGSADARLVLVGEQPGDQEDRAGRPFVGPAGQVLDDALRQAGIDRRSVYVTNAVKHFHHEPRGKARIHAKPEARHVQACRGWLLAELAAVRPEVIVCLGATAAQAFMGARFRILKSRGQVFENVHARHWLATYHPAALLRMPDPAQREQAERDFVEDLRVAARILGG